ncbi:MAG: hypothetical protein A3E98_00215 [Candidatus Doudnabacteria bacterium RIFCSPHIGHO2_12_FULL_48_11]|uniref:Glycosyltransferase RgtA/B/C/D-like domain-containing protein n=1 Tax=Candidatus Doudnabacteria bacterium RIFCSPHIGHO2_01_FULL_46_24 TaxID=1817825 RepID=A0A1F5NVM6_9BACT|nr:MAG: hypothetical protein A2720_02570 [Candidatus Doudnabacteria bacterium RIFCSPHIGHO2_01_FULL_46_24]OGE94234.1 MAG: hypothetical protein A3E98_00215 [Candidatus Doudnabacteria bacterium RIFCSPHIGHO2_12_FULL_48_11]
MQLFAILILGAILRLYHNISVALWHDEAFSALYIRYPWGEMLGRIIADVHPPLYYFILRFWSYIFGQSLLSLRGLSILFGIATIWMGFVLFKQIFSNKKWALLAALLIAINPFQIQYALEARMYTLGTFLSLVTCYLLLKALENDQRKYWVWYGITAALTLYTHYFLFFTVAAQVIYIIYVWFKKRISLKNPLLSGIIVAAMYAPWLPSFLVQNRRVSEAYWIPEMDRWAIPGTVWKMIFGGQNVSRPLLILTTLACIALLIYFWRKTKSETKFLILFSLLVPFLGSILISLKTSIYLDRYFVFAGLFLIAAIAAALMQVPNYSVRRILAAVLVILSLAMFFKNWKELNIKNKPGMAAASRIINEQATKDDKIYVGSSFIFFTFRYYNETGIKPLLYSSGSLETIPHFSGTALLTNDDLILDFKQAEKNDRVWLLWTTGFGASKPNVPGNWSIVSEHEFQDTPDFKGKIVVTEYHVN